MENKIDILNAIQPETDRFSKQHGNVTYEVSVNFKQGATETLDKKILRLIKNEMGHYND